jgi:hypothetical protein
VAAVQRPSQQDAAAAAQQSEPVAAGAMRH